MGKLIFLALILFGCFSVFAQTERTITEEDFANVVKGAEKSDFRLYLSPYRLNCDTEIILDFKDGKKFVQLIKFSVEQDKNGRHHYISELSGYSLEKSKPDNWKYETVSSDRGKIFERKDDGDWYQVSKRTKDGGCMGLSLHKHIPDEADSPNIIAKSVEYKYLGSEEINSEPANIYARFEKYTLVENSGRIISKSFISKGWFRNDGLMIKSELEIQIDNKGNKSITHSVQTWEKLAPRFEIKIPKLPDV